VKRLAILMFLSLALTVYLICIIGAAEKPKRMLMPISEKITHYH